MAMPRGCQSSCTVMLQKCLAVNACAWKPVAFQAHCLRALCPTTAAAGARKPIATIAAA